MTDPPNKKRLKTAPMPTSISIISSECVECLLGGFLENRDKGLLSMSCKQLYEYKSNWWWKCYCCKEHISDRDFSEMQMCSNCCNVDCGRCDGFRPCSECDKYYCEGCADEVLMQGCEIGSCGAHDNVCCVELGKCGECGRRNCADCFEAGGHCNYCDEQFCHSCAPSGGKCEDCYENNDNEDGDY